MHECPLCGEACSCDGEDLWHDDAPDDCACECDFDEDDWDEDEDEDNSID